MRQAGFTLVELLVTMAIIGILLAVILNLQSSTISFTDKQSGLTQRLQAINDVSGYIGDRVKAAQLVPDGLSLPIGGTSTGTSACSRAGTEPCLAVVLPVVDATCGLVVNWRLHAFRYVPRSPLPANEKVALPGLDITGVYGLREIRVPSGVADGTCTAPMNTVPTTFSGTSTSGMLADNLVLPTGTDKAFEYDPDKKIVTLRLRSVAANRAGTLEHTPSSGPYKLQVFARNVS